MNSFNINNISTQNFTNNQQSSNSMDTTNFSQLCFQTDNQNICLSVQTLDANNQTSLSTQGPIGRTIGEIIGGGLLLPVGLSDFGARVGGNVGDYLGDFVTFR